MAKNAGALLAPPDVPIPGEEQAAAPAPFDQAFDQAITRTLAPKQDYATPGPYITKLSSEEEAQFQDWVKHNNIPFDPSPNADYDMRGFWKAQQSGDPTAKRAANLHFPDTWKTPYHKTFSNESIYSKPDAPHWEGNKLIDKNGNVVVDESAPAPQPQQRTTTPAFDQAFDQAIDRTRAGAAWNPLEAGKEILSTARAGTKSIYEGLANSAAHLFDPSLKYTDRSARDLQAGIAAAQARYDELEKETASEGDSEFDVTRRLSQMAELRSNIEAQKHALARQVEPGYQPTLAEQIAAGAQASARAMEKISAQEQGQLPAPEPKNLADQLLNQPLVLTPNPVYESTIPGQVARTVGGAIPFGLGAIAGAGLGPIAGFGLESTLFGGATAQAGIEEARAAGKDEEVQAAAAMYGIASGPVQAAAFRFLNLAPWLRGEGSRTVGEFVKTVAKQAGLATAGSEAQRVYDNVVAQATGIDPNRKMTDGLGQNLLTNAVGMAIFTGGIEAPSLAMRSISKPRISVYEPGRAPAEAGEGTVPAPPEDARARARAEAEGVLAQEEPAAPAVAPATPPPPVEPPSEAQAQPEAAPPARKEIRNTLSDLVDQVGPRANFLLANERSLPSRYRKALADADQTPENFKAFFDHATGDFVVNPNNIASEEELHDAIIRNFVPNTFADKAKIVPISSWHDEAAGDQKIAEMISLNANANTSVGGLYSTSSGQVYLNVPKLLEAADPIHEALKTAVHEISVHQGIRTWFGDPHYMATFLNQVYNGMEQSGMGNHVAGTFGTDMEGLARQYGYGKEAPDGSWQMDAIDRAKTGEELLARYAERFDPNELDKAPAVIQRAVEYLRGGLRRFQGLDFDGTDAFHFIRDAWRATDPARDPLADNAALARRIGKSYVPPELESRRAAQRDTREFDEAQRGVSPSGRGVQPERGTGNQTEAVVRSSDRVGAYAQATGRVIDYSALSRNTARQISKPLAEEHDILEPVAPERNRFFVKLTKFGGFGPYGQHLELLGAQPGQIEAHAIAGRFISGPATAEQYLERLGLSNTLFDSRYNLEGFIQDPQTGLWQVVTTQPSYLNHRPANVDEIVHYMEQRGFMPVDTQTFYDPTRKILVADAHSANVLADRNTGRITPIDVVPQRVDGKMANELEKIVNDPNREAAITKDINDVYRFLLAQGIDISEKPSPEAEQATRIQEQARSEEAEQKDLQTKAAQGVLTSEERARLDELEFGQFMRRDIEQELGPEAKGLPENILRRAQETLDIMRPTQGVAEAARKIVIDPSRPEAVRLAAASPTQLLYEKTGEAVWEPEAQAIYDQHKGDLDAIAADIMSGLRDEDITAYAYKKVTNDVATNRAAAEGNPVRQAQWDAFQANLDDWFVKQGTRWGQEGAARANAWFAKDGILTRYRRQLNDFFEKRVKRDPVFKDAVEKLRDLVRRTTDAAINDAKPILDQAQRLRNFRLPAEYAKAMAEDLTRHFSNLPGSAAEDKPMLEELFKRFRNTIEAKIKERVDMGGPPDAQKISASTTIRDALSQWKWLDDIWNQAVNDLKSPEGPNPLFFQRLNDAMDVPFTQSQLARAVREQGVSISDMVRQHRSQIGTTVKSLSQALTERTGLTPEHAQAVEKAIDTYIRTAVDAKTRAEFDKIIDRANNGKPSASGRPIATKRFVDLVNMGAFSDNQVANALAPAFGLKSFDPRFVGDISALGDKLEQYKQQGRGSLAITSVLMQMERRLAEQRFDSMSKQGKLGDIAMNVYMGNILSGVPTHVIALMSDFFNGTGNVLSRLIATRRIEAIPRLMYALVKGFTRGVDTAAYVTQTGFDPSTNINPDELLAGARRYLSAKNTSETDPSQRILQQYGLETLGKGIDWYKYIGRSITAAHSLMYEGFSAPLKWLTAYDQIMKEGNLPRHKAMDRANEMMFGGKADVDAAKLKAKAEGLTGRDARLRVQELINEQQPQDIRDLGDYYGRHTMFTQAPQGALGSIARALQQLVREVPYVRTIVPFTNVVSNILNESLNYSPLGLWRGGLFHQMVGADPMNVAEKFLTAGGREKFTEENLNRLRNDLLIKGFAGIGLTTAFYMLAKQMGWQINGPGPSDWRKKQQLMSAGWVPNSLKMGNTYVTFEATPLAIPLSIIGSYEDAQRYENKDGLDRLLYMASNAVHVIMDRSYLKGMTDFLDAFHGQADAEGATHAAASQLAQLKNFVPIAGLNLIRQFYQQFVDPTMYQPDKDAPAAEQLGQLLLRDFPMVPSLMGEKPRLNILGEPIRTSPLTRRFWSTQTDDEVWNFITSKNLIIGKPTPGTKLLGETMTPEQLYDYAKVRGQHIKEDMAAQLPRLQAIEDPDKLKNAIQDIERRAAKKAKADMIRAGH